MNVEKWIEDNTIFKYRAGSHSYGLNTPESDVDIRGVCIPPIDYWLGVHNFEQYSVMEPNDIVIYGLRKFFDLASNSNPNIIEFLYADNSDYLKTTPIWERIRQNRHLFLSKKAKFTFSGYAISQLKRIQTHKKWLMNIPEKPKRSDYGLPEDKSLINSTAKGAVENLIKEGYTLSSSIMQIYQKEHEYKNAKATYDQYLNWEKNRNQKRFELEEKYGYDTKHASHLVRLLKMGTEILTTGEVHVKRPDREELIAVRNGEWSFDYLINWTKEQDELLNELYETSPLQHKPRKEEINQLLIDIVKGHLK